MLKNLRQPKGLPVFFLTEMWERYGFYVLQTLLVLFLSQHFQFSDVQSYSVLGSFTALSYAMTILGGYIADKALGYRHAVILGGLLLSIGYACLTYSYNIQLFYVSLAIVTTGTGLFKPNVSSLLGTLYSAEDKRRDAGYTLFYVGINFGIISASALSGYLVRYYGWHYAFASASLMLIVGVITFIWGTLHYKIYDKRPIQRSFLKYIATYLMLIVFIASCTVIMQNETWSLIFFALMCVAILFVLGFIALVESGRQRRRIFAYCMLILLSIVFWAIYFQLFFSLTLFIERVVSHQILGFTIPTPAMVCIESAGIIILGPILGRIWTRLNQAKRPVSIPAKFSFGIGFLVIAFALLYFGILFTASAAQVMLPWLILAYLAISIGELALSPIGLAMVVELAPPRFVGLMMGIFLVSLGLGGKVAGLIANIAALPSGTHTIEQMKAMYQHAFLIYTWVALAATIVGIIFTPLIRRLIRDR